MSNLIPSNQRSAIESVLDDIHQTFGRTIYAYKEAETTFVSLNPDYNALYGNVDGGQAHTTQTPVTGSFTARISYLGQQKEEGIAEGGAQLKLERPAGQVRIKIDQNGYNFIKSSKRIKLDDRMFIIDSDVRPHGLFSPKYYTFYLKPVDFE